MPLHIHDTLRREKRVFTPRDPNRVTLYVCGPTVYDYAHIGNARPPVVFDVLVRLLRRTYGPDKVVYARNVTDVDDKINAKAAKEGVAIGEITARYEAAYLADMGLLNVSPPDIAPHVTDYIDAITAQIQAIIDAGNAYAAEGHVLFDVSSYPSYGALSGRNLDDMIAGARVEVAPYKKNPHDFVLWKPSKADEPSWPSPWGEGRPGWHIECSAMIEKTLGLPIDIHGGGIDLVFPHHENEIAQGVCAHGHAHGDQAHDEYARYWMHNGFLTVDAEKMSKSIGNVLLLHDLVKAMPGEVVRWALLSAHYRQPLDWNQTLLEQSRKNLDRLYGVLRDADAALADFDEATLDEAEMELAENAMDAVLDALEDDLNTPGAIAQLFGLGNALRDLLNDAEADINDVAMARWSLTEAAGLLGVLAMTPDAWFEGGDPALKAEVEALLEQRASARADKNWAEADRIRDRLNELNVVVMDGPQGATWRVKG
ncbi:MULTISPECIES: cysteine--tRNA ligase [unclassified Brevundimonas]|uniref:cysteine--tRNA ligase n=1 Tax=unclassified Brevundimonas TaxID=2622653 RepID=UPI000CFBF44B|nr:MULTISPECIES: cysteine--tRNA ligase [unclassified Brevundimonas]PRA30478.1 cysteine--tRNA ligase [Brevundimonas sp. MYb27]PQZ83245.1 cysteine--tRNA ligase [Brevundimonas sp. MYb31]PRB16222.1 cysteine--tRNA ligase [Brevundimonas sp. MYb52]PRB35167.1 cysteine--tRNA ligase [Brevundimonas sp. MYb46]PRB49852.1 cysteine--tRNA ligase [Brevundimonas sp. MYb33]